MIQAELSDSDAKKLRDDLVFNPQRWDLSRDDKGVRRARRAIGPRLHTADGSFFGATCYIEERLAEYRSVPIIWSFMRQVRVPLKHSYTISVVADGGPLCMTSECDIVSHGITDTIDEFLFNRECRNSDVVREYMDDVLRHI